MMRFLFRHAYLRRVLTVGLLGMTLLSLSGAMPVLLPVAGLYDVVSRKTRFARFLLFLWFFAALEIVGITRSFMVLVTTPNKADRVTKNFALQAWWAHALLGAAARMFQFTFDVRGDEVLKDSPYVLMLRHASVADTLLPAVFAQYAFGARLRYVLKEELLLDPCLDIVGHQLPNCFVKRGAKGGGHAPQAELQKIETLTHALGDDGIVIFPEGTRFTEKKRDRLLSKIAAGDDDERLARAAELRHVLPPRRGGALQLLDATRCDVVFCAHTGFETIEKLSDLWRPALFQTHVRMHFWRVKRSDIPQAAQRADWLFAQWRDVDNAIEAMQTPALVAQ